jgi:hypothetical protein
VPGSDGGLAAAKVRASRDFVEWAVAGSNRGPPPCKGGALTS